MMTVDVAVFLRRMLASQQVAVGAPDFAEVAALAAEAMAQLDQIIEGDTNG